MDNSDFSLKTEQNYKDEILQLEKKIKEHKVRLVKHIK
jgi:hypothetical protein